MNFLSPGLVNLLRFTLVNSLRNGVVNLNRGTWAVCSGICGQFTPFFPPKVLFIAALKSCASCIILVHNHPSGNLKASKADHAITQKIKKGGRNSLRKPWLIKKETGKTAHDYIQSKVIDIAKEGIFDINKSISEIVYELGFKYPQHFTRSFKQSLGMT